MIDNPVPEVKLPLPPQSAGYTSRPTATSQPLELAVQEMGVPDASLLIQHRNNWIQARADHECPYLSDLFAITDPLTQPYLVVIDTEHMENQRVRLEGTGIIDFFGFDATGFDFLQSVRKEVRHIFVEAHQRLAQERIGKLHEAVCSTSSGRELVVHALALPYRRRSGLPCAAWILKWGSTMQYGETGAQVRDITKQAWINFKPAPDLPSAFRMPHP